MWVLKTLSSCRILVYGRCPIVYKYDLSTPILQTLTKAICTTPFLKKKKYNTTPIIFYKNKKEVVKIRKNMTVKELAEVLNKTMDDMLEILSLLKENTRCYKDSTIIKNLFTIQEAVNIAGKRFVIETPKQESEKENKDAVKRPPALESELVPRPPVVTIMGHVDHGKTTLLDALRNSSIVDTEFGGITQHIGAFNASLPSGDSVTFLDTPGHAAFSAMRSRGARVTDLIVLVVAAEDGVMSQTQEVIELSKETAVPIIVAINKIDKYGANIPACKQALLRAGIQLEEQGGDIQVIEISALKRINLDLLLEALIVQAEVLNLRSDPKSPVEATVIESKQETGPGKLATCLIQRGTLKKGCILVAGNAWAKVRNMFDDSGKIVNEATPGKAVQVIGWRELPSAGDEVLEVKNEKRVKEVLQWRKEQELAVQKAKDAEAIKIKVKEHRVEYRAKVDERLSLGNRINFKRQRPPHEKLIKFDPRPRLCMVLKGDVDGSIDAILGVLDSYKSKECPIEMLTYGVGPVTQGDIKLAADFKGVVYAFNTPVPEELTELAEQNGVSIYELNIIYRLVERIKEDISDRLPQVPTEFIIGEATMQQEFIVKEGKQKIPIAGSLCMKGTIKKKDQFKVVRDKEVIHTGLVSEIRHHKSIVESVKAGVECGIRFEDTSVRFSPGDQIIGYKIEDIKQKSDWNPPGF